MPRERPKRITHSKLRPPRPGKAPRAAEWADAVMQFRDHLNGPAEAMPRTIRMYAKALARFKAWWEGDETRKKEKLEVSGVVSSDLRDYREFLREEVVCEGTVSPRKRKAGSVNALMAPVRSFFFWAADAGLIKEAPTMPKRVKATKGGNKAITVPDQKKVFRIIERGRNKRDFAILTVLLDCGLRASELCALRWRDVKLTRGSPEVYIWEGKGDKQGKVDLSPKARKALIDLAGDEKPHPDSPVFASRKGKGEKSLSRRGLENLLATYGSLAGVKLTPHMCRHACATDMLNRGHQIATVQQVLRHRSVTTTLGYTHTSPELMRKAVDRGGEGDDE